MNFSRWLLAAVFFCSLGAPTHASLFETIVSLRIYSLDGKGRLRFHAGNAKFFIDQVVQNTQLDPKTLTLAYDDKADALKVVRKSDGSLIATVMTFSSGLNIATAEKSHRIHAFRQTFLTLSGSGNVTQGSVAGPVSVEFDHGGNTVAYHWDGDFQYSIPGDMVDPNRVVQGKFIVGHEVHKLSVP